MTMTATITTEEDVVTVDATVFPSTVSYVFDILVGEKITRIEIERRQVVFFYEHFDPQDNKDKPAKVIVTTKNGIGRFPLLAFLITPALFPFRSERWLNDQLNVFGEKLALVCNGQNTIVDLEGSKK